MPVLVLLGWPINGGKKSILNCTLSILGDLCRIVHKPGILKPLSSCVCNSEVLTVKIRWRSSYQSKYMVAQNASLFSYFMKNVILHFLYFPKTSPH